MIQSCSQFHFREQSLVSFTTTSCGSSKKNTLSTHPPSCIHSIERNENGQIYVMNDLHKNPHFTLKTSDVLSLYRDTTLSSIDSNLEETQYLHVPKNCNYISDDKSLLVINDQSLPTSNATTTITKDQLSIRKYTQLITEMFHYGLSESLTFNTKKRSVSSKATKMSSITKRMHSKYEGRTHRKSSIDKTSLPMCNMGWSLTDCNEYGGNMSTIAGTVKPFLKKGNIPLRASRILVQLIELLLKALDHLDIFNNESCDDMMISNERRRMQRLFKSFLNNGDKYNDKCDADFFRVEGITIIIPSNIGLHTDNLNCDRKGMTSVLSINCQVPLNEDTIVSGSDSQLWNWFTENGYTESFNCSIICYSRRCVGNYVHKLASSYRIAEKDSLRNCIHWALTTRVGKAIDYKSHVWNNSYFPNVFNNHKKKRVSGTFGGDYMVVPAAYDKMVSAFVVVSITKYDFYTNF